MLQVVVYSYKNVILLQYIGTQNGVVNIWLLCTKFGHNIACLGGSLKNSFPIGKLMVLLVNNSCMYPKLMVFVILSVSSCSLCSILLLLIVRMERGRNGIINGKVGKSKGKHIKAFYFSSIQRQCGYIEILQHTQHSTSACYSFHILSYFHYI